MAIRCPQPPTTMITLKVNGVQYEIPVEPRKLLSDFLREDLGLTGTHIGCEHGACGACTIIMDGRTVRSCLTFAVQAGGAEIITIEGLAKDESLNPVQEAFNEAHGLQCGFCTPGMVITSVELLNRNPNPTDEEIRVAISGNICRCTGYKGIVDAIKLAGEKLREQEG